MALARLDSVFTCVFLGRDPGSRVVLWLRAAGSALAPRGLLPLAPGLFLSPLLRQLSRRGQGRDNSVPPLTLQFLLFTVC